VKSRQQGLGNSKETSCSQCLEAANWAAWVQMHRICTTEIQALRSPGNKSAELEVTVTSQQEVSKKAKKSFLLLFSIWDFIHNGKNTNKLLK
jgi:hypothetical protein